MPPPPPRAPDLLTDFRTRAAYAEGAGIYRTIPAAVAVPSSVTELQRLVRWAAESRTTLIPRGAGSGMPGGNVGPGVIVDLAQSLGGVTVDPARRTAHAGASVTWAQVNDAARVSGLRLPPDPSSGAFATCGGMAATNAAGPRSVRSGSVRRWIEALEVVGADGEVRRMKRGVGSGERFALDPEPRRLVAAKFPKTRK
ncbi:MAG: FAD-binding oxidoreductase, partial [Gemmatimonadales bacterium]